MCVNPILDNIVSRAQSAPKHIVLPEGHDPRIIKGAWQAAHDGIAKITLIGNPDDIIPQLNTHDSEIEAKIGSETQEINLTTPQTSQVYLDAYIKANADKHITPDTARAALLNPLNFANMMVKMGKADGCVAGAAHTTSDVVRAALNIIGTEKTGAMDSLVSSFFIMLMPQDHKYLNGGVIFSDCGLVINPDARQLAKIAITTARSGKALLGHEPKLAMLSFSTYDSAKHASVDKVKSATDLVRRDHPHINIDGPLQFDAAIIADIAAQKAPGSAIKGAANILIFPDLNSGNIAYKITERLGGAKAIGPILQGLNKPANDLSRGCDSEDVYNMIAITVLQAQINQPRRDTLHKGSA